MSKEAHNSSSVEVRVANILGDLLMAEKMNQVTRRKVMQSLCDATSSDAWLWTFATRKASRNSVTPFGTVLHEGFMPGRLGAWIAAAQESLSPLPLIKPIVNELRTGVHFTSTQRLLMTDEQWQANLTVQKYRLQEDFDDAIYSVHSQLEGKCSVVCFYRRKGRSQYEGHDQQVTHLVLSSMKGLTAPEHHEKSSDLRLSLTRTQQVVYTLLLQGLRRPEIAEALHIAKATARDHIRAVLRTYEARDQLELICQYHAGHLGEPSPPKG